MTRMAPLLERNGQFACTYTPVALGPPAAEVLVVTCLDHRVDPAIILGLQLGDALVIRNTGGRGTQAVIDDVLASIQGGSSLSAAFERHPKVFDTLYVSIVKAGETSGNLDRVLADLGRFLEWKADLKRDVIQATIYPCMVLTAILGLIILLATVVFPQFATVLNQSKGPVPIPTQILFFLSRLFTHYWWVLLLTVITGLSSFWM